MAKVKIQGHASGTGVLTVTAPNTSSDRTITLPDSTGTLLDENSSLPAANLTGTIADARLGSGTASSSTVLYGDQTYKAAPTTDLTAPGAIGGTTPAAGTFTTLEATYGQVGHIGGGVIVAAAGGYTVTVTSPSVWHVI